MHLVSALAAGVNGAGNGWAELYRRGTSTRASWYSSFEAESGTQNATGANITLDSNGGAIVYVAELVDVVVKNSLGTTVREFVAGAREDAVEVQSSSFTGTDYQTGATGVNKPTTLAAVHDRWITSAGAPDFNVNVNGSTVTIQQAVSGTIFVNVKQFGAEGDGVTDDLGAINAAFLFADSIDGAMVYFPPGTYLVSDEIEVIGNVNILGTRDSEIERSSSDHAAIEWTTAGSFNTVTNLRFLEAATGANDPMVTIPSTSSVTFVDCVFWTDSTPTGITSPIANTDCGNLFLDRCFIALEGVDAVIVNRTGAGLLAATFMSGCFVFWLGSAVFANAGLDGVMRISGNSFATNCDAGCQPPVLIIPRTPSTITGNTFTTTLTDPEVVLAMGADATAGGGTANGIVESGNVLQQTNIRYTSFSGHMLCHSRSMRQRVYTVATGATLDLDLSDAGLQLITTTGGAGTVTIRFGASLWAPNESAEADVIIRNTTANAHAITTVGTSPIDTTVALGANQIARIRWIYTTVGGTTTWWRVTGYTVTVL